MRGWNLIVLLLLEIQCWHDGVNAKVVDFNLNTGQSCFKFITRFCFAETPESTPTNIDGQSDDGGLSEIGTVRYEINFPKHIHSLKILMFYHDEESWNRVIDNSKTTCYQKYLVAKETSNVYPVPYEDTRCTNKKDAFTTGCILTLKGQVSYHNGIYPVAAEQPLAMVKYKDYMYFNTNRARYFYFALVNVDSEQCERDAGATCDGPISNVSGSLHFTNHIDGKETEFSYDEYGLDICVTIFAVFELLTLSVLLGFSAKLFLMGKLHVTVILLILGIASHMIGLFMYLADLNAYASDGIGTPQLEAIAIFLWAAGDICLLAQVLLLAKGWTVVRRKLTGYSRIRIAVVLTMYAYFQIAFLVWHEAMDTEETQKFSYDSLPGYFLVCVRTLLWVWFLRCVLRTLQRFGKKRRFYGKFAIAGTFWFVSVPVIFCSSYIYDIYIRKKWIIGMQMAYTCLAHIVFVSLYNPYTRCNKGFPFHALAKDMKPSRQVVIVGAGGTGTGRTGTAAMVISRTFNQEFKPIHNMQKIVRALAMRFEQMHSIANFLAEQGIPELIESAERGSAADGGGDATKVPSPQRAAQPARGTDDNGGFFWNGQRRPHGQDIPPLSHISSHHEHHPHHSPAGYTDAHAPRWRQGGDGGGSVADRSLMTETEMSDTEHRSMRARSMSGHDSREDEPATAESGKLVETCLERRVTGVVSCCLALHGVATVRMLQVAESRNRVADHIRIWAHKLGVVESFHLPLPPDVNAGKAFLAFQSKVDALNASEEFVKEFDISFVSEKVLAKMSEKEKESGGETSNKPQKKKISQPKKRRLSSHLPRDDYSIIQPSGAEKGEPATTPQEAEPHRTKGHRPVRTSSRRLS